MSRFSRRILNFGLTGLILAILFVSTVEPALSAGSRQSDEPFYHFVLAYRELATKDYLCLNEEMKIRVQVLDTLSDDDPISGFPVTALVTGGTGTVTPNEPVWLEFGSTPPETAEFIFYANKVGKEKLFFEARVPDLWSLIRPPPRVYIEKPLEFEVVNCKQKVNLIFDEKLRDAGVHWDGVGLIKDAIAEQGDDGVYHGSGDFEFHTFNHATTDGQCVYQPHTVVAPADITGQPIDDLLNWTIAYADATGSVTATCVDVGTQTFDNLHPLSEYGPSAVTTPSSGGAVRYSRSWSWPTGGESGTFTIIVEPEDEEPAVSRTGDPGFWSLDWFEAALMLNLDGQ